jgi:hypothetical protein
MAPVFLGIILLVSLAATAWKCSSTWPTLHRDDRIGAMVFFTVVGLPALVFGLALIAQATIA